MLMKRKGISKVMAITLSAAIVLGTMPEMAVVSEAKSEASGEYVNEEQEVNAEPDYDGFLKALQAGLDAFESTVDVSSYNIPSDDVGSFYSVVVYRNSRNFFVRGFSQTVSADDIAQSVTFKYIDTVDNVRNMLSKYDAAVANALAGIDENATDIEKILYINDYLALNTEYDTTGGQISSSNPGLNATAYGALVEKKATCMGYTYAFQQLAEELGLESWMVTSSSLNHAWNMVKLGKSYYNVDTTWDDPLIDIPGRAMHKYLLKSTEYFKSQEGGHNANDWLIDGMASPEDASDTSLDSCAWDDVNTGFFKIGNLWYTMNTSEGGIVAYEINGTTVTCQGKVLSLEEEWPTGEILRHKIASINDVLYYSTPDSVCSYDPTTGETAVYYTLTEEQKEKGSIYGLRINEKGQVYVYVTPDGKTEGTVYEVGTITPSREPVEPTIIPTSVPTATLTPTPTPVGEYPEYKLGTLEFTTLEDETITVAPSDKPKVLVLYVYTCYNTVNAANILKGYDLSGVDVIFAEVNDTSKERVEAVKDAWYEDTDEITFCYNAGALSWSIIPTSVGYSYSTPLILYVDKDNTVVYHTTGVYNKVVEDIEEHLGVTLEKRTYGDISKKSVTLSTDTFTYDGTEKKPEVIVKETDGRVVSPTEYEVSYQDNVDAGTASVTVKGKNKVTGEKTLNFTIEKADYSILETGDSFYSLYQGETCQIPANTDAAGLVYTSDKEEVATVSETGLIKAVSEGTANITVSTAENKNYNTITKNITVYVRKAESTDKTSITDCTVGDITEEYTYDGTEKQPKLTVSYNNTVLTEETDYTLGYTDNVDAGTAFVTVKGRGKYSGIVTKTFKIAKAQQPLEVKVHSKDMEVGDSIRFTVSAPGSISVSSEDTSIASVNNKNIITALAPGKVSMQVSAKETKNYQAAEETVELNVTEASSQEKTNLSRATILLSKVTPYNGEEKKPSITVLTKTTLQKDVDYVVSYENNVNAGTGTIVVNGIGAYTGAATQTFTIDKADQDVVATMGKETLKPNEFTKINVQGYGKVEYELSDTSIADVIQGYFTAYKEGEVTVKVTAKGNDNYNEGSTTLKVKVSNTSEPVEPEVTITPGVSGAPEVTTTPGVSGAPEVTTTPGVSEAPEVTTTPGASITPTVSGSPTEPATSVTPGAKKNLSSYMIRLQEQKFTYTGSEICPDMTVAKRTNATEVLTKDKDYSVSYENNVNAGKATITVTGMGDYTGTLTKTFTIEKADQQVIATIGKDSVKLNETVKIDVKGHGEIQYQLSDEYHAQITDGYFTALALGEVAIRITAMGDDNYNEAATMLWVKIVDSTDSSEKKNITDYTITLAEREFAYTGSEICPDVTVAKQKDASEVLTKDKDYSVSYTDNTDAGIATVTVTGIGDYTGTISENFVITRAKNRISVPQKAYTLTANQSKAVKLKLNATAQGKLKYVPDNSKVKVSSSGVVTIPKKFVGIVNIKITSPKTDNCYADSCTVTVTVNPSVTKLTSAKLGNKKLTLKWKKNSTATGYEIQYSTNSKFKSGVSKKTAGKNSTSLTIKRLKSGKKYYVRMRTVYKFKYKGKNKTLYSSWSTVKRAR